MLSFLLAVAAAAHDAPAALCPPCHEEEPATAFGFLVSVIKSVVSLLVIVFPLYKTFKAFESNRLRACRTMLAYWSAMTLINALKDVTDELVLNYVNVSLHHLIVAALKLAPLAIGPDKIYDMTVRSFFESHEEQMDAMVLKGSEVSQQVKDKMEPTLEAVKEQVHELKEKVEPMIEKVERSVEPTLEQIRESLRESMDTVKSTLGMETEADSSTSTELPHELSAEEALRRDEELTIEQDNTSKTGLRQRSARMATNSTSPTGVTPEAESEIEKAKQRNVLVEKIVWGHGLSAKNDEYQRQLKEKEAVQDSVVADVHSVANQFNTVPAASPHVSETSKVTTTSVVSNNAMTGNVTASPPPLPPRPAEPTDAITISNNNNGGRTLALAANFDATKHHHSSSTGSANLSPLPKTPTTVLDARNATPTSGVVTKTVLLDTRSIPNIVETYTTDNQKEL